MKQMLSLMMLPLILCTTGCGRSFFPVYVVEMTVSRPGETGPETISESGLLATTESYQEDTALVEDELVTISAALRKHSIWISLVSKSDQPLEIIWSETTVTHSGMTETLFPYVIRNNTTESRLPTFGDKGQGDPDYADKPQPPMTIEPLGWVSVEAIPKSFCHYVRSSKNPEGSWSTRDRFFFNAKIDAKQNYVTRKATMAATVGQQIVVLLPLKTPNGRVDYTINLTVHEAKVGKYTHYIM